MMHCKGKQDLACVTIPGICSHSNAFQCCTWQACNLAHSEVPGNPYPAAGHDVGFQGNFQCSSSATRQAQTPSTGRLQASLAPAGVLWLRPAQGL